MKKWIAVILTVCFLFQQAILPVKASSTTDRQQTGITKIHQYLDGRNVKVGIIDLGFNVNDAALKGHIEKTYYYGATDRSSMQSASHGTGCAKELAAIAPKAKLYLMVGEWDEMIDWAIQEKLDIISCSLWSDIYPDSWTEEILKKAYDAGITMIFSGGNTGKKEMHYPASYDTTISVTACTWNKDKKQFVVNKNATHNNKNDICAPGGSTSIAAPFVAGVAALLYQVSPNLDAKTCRNVLTSTALDLGSKGKDDYYGYGLIQPEKALKKLGYTMDTKDLKNASISLSKKTYTYDGKAKKPNVTVKLEGKTLKKDRDYTVKYKKNKSAGTAQVVISSKGSYKGSITKTFSIKKQSMKKAKVSLSKKSYRYNGKAKKPTVTIKVSGNKLKKNQDYTISYKNNKKVGKASVIIKGKGNYKDTYTAYFYIKR